MSVHSQEEANRIYHGGQDAFDTLMGGPRKWNRIHPEPLRRDSLSDALLLQLAHGDYRVKQDYIALLEEEAVRAVREAAYALRCWASVNGRHDLTMSAVQRIEQMVQGQP
jgi:hypothetical protein